MEVANPAVAPDGKSTVLVKRLPLVTLGLSFPKRRRQRWRAGAKEEAAAESREASVLARGKNTGLLARLPNELVRRILDEFVGARGDILPVRATCVMAEHMCNEILANRVMLRLSNPASVRMATMWCKSLTEMRVDGSPLSDNDLCAIARGCPKLQLFSAPSLDHVTAHGLGMFFSFLDHLECVDLPSCPALDDWAVMRLAERCRKLRSVKLRRCDNVGVGGIRALARYSNLSVVDLSHCRNVDNACLRTLLASPSVALKSLALAGCTALDHSSLRCIGQCCPDLEALDISGLPNLTDATCAAIAKGCSRLVMLRCSDCPRIKAGVTVLLTLCKRLEAMHATGCARLSDICFVSLKSAPPALRALDVKGCPLVTARGLAALRRACPRAVVGHDVAPSTVP